MKRSSVAAVATTSSRSSKRLASATADDDFHYTNQYYSCSMYFVPTILFSPEGWDLIELKGFIFHFNDGGELDSYEEERKR